MTYRPPPPDWLPEGRIYVAAPETDPNWRVLTPEHEHNGFIVRAELPKPCRWMENRRSCKAPSVAVLTRGRAGREYHYCEEHLYGRWIEDGVLMRWQYVPEPTCVVCGATTNLVEEEGTWCCSPAVAHEEMA